jgi:hypothetical protein
MRKIYLVLKIFVDKIFAKKVLIKVVKTTLIIMFIIASITGIASKSAIGYLVLGLFFCLFYIFLYVINELMKEDEVYIKKTSKI